MYFFSKSYFYVSQFSKGIFLQDNSMFVIAQNLKKQ